MPEKERVRLTLRLKPDDHRAIKRMAVELDTSINKLLDLLVSKSVPRKYYGDIYNKEEQ